jgi:hypothetical protein
MKDCTAKMTEATIPPFPFLRLPREIRDCIYRHLLAARLAYTDDYQRRDDSWPVRFAPAILRANKQISREAAQILYKENDWVVLKVNTQEYSCLDDFPSFVGLFEHQIPQPTLKITIKELEAEPLAQRTFIFTLEGIPYFIEQLWEKAKMCDFFYSMIFELSLFNKTPSRHNFLNNQIVRSFDQIQGFAVLIFHGDIDTNVVSHLSVCMTLGQHLKDVCTKMAELFCHGESCFKRTDYTLARRYWDRLTLFHVYRYHLLLWTRRTPSRRTRYSIQNFLEATLTIILKMDLGQRMIELHTKQYQKAANHAQNALTRVGIFINQYSLDYHVPPVLEAKFWICKSVGQFALGDRVESNSSHNRAVAFLCLDPRFASQSFTEVSQELELARAKYLEEQADTLNGSKKNGVTLTLETDARFPVWRSFGH